MHCQLHSTFYPLYEEDRQRRDRAVQIGDFYTICSEIRRYTGVYSGLNLSLVLMNSSVR